MGKIKRMDQIKTILKRYAETKSIKSTARILHVSRNTVRTYLRRLEAAGKSIADLDTLSDDELHQVFYMKEQVKSFDRLTLFNSLSAYWLKELKKVGVSRYLLWEEYRLKYGVPKTFCYSQFCNHLRRLIGLKGLSIAMHHQPGEVMQVDFAGKKMHWVDEHTGELMACEILVAVMPHSQHTFVIALESQKVEDFVHGLNQALLFFGRLPKVILSDNLKSFVTRASKYEPKFNELCEQLGAHYGIDLSATRVAKPKDKVSVENSVGIMYNRIYGPLRNETYHSIAALNSGIRTQLELHNSKPYQKREGNRKLVFEQDEFDKMRPLPSDLFEVKKSTKAKAQRNYHVLLGEDKNFYSIPYQYALSNTIITYTAKTVEVYLGPKRIAIHKRLASRNAYHYQTDPKHMPSNHLEWKKAQGYDAAYFIKEAKAIGPATEWAIQQIILSKIYEPQTFNSCKGVLMLGKKYTPSRLEQACQRCRPLGKTSYQMLKRILNGNLDRHEQEITLFNVPQHENIRGPEAYQ